MITDKKQFIPVDRSKYLRSEEIDVLLEAALKIGRFEYEFLKFIANTGVRPSEAIEVKGSDVDSKNNYVRVRTLKQKKEFNVFRCVDLSPLYSKELGEVAKRAGEVRPVFPRSRQALWGIFKRVAAKAGISKVYTLYSLRHSRCVYLFESTNDIMYVSQQMGFNLSGMGVYWHCLQERRDRHIKNIPTFGVQINA